MRGELSREDREVQATRFLGWYRKGSGPWDEAFVRWAESKEFGPADLMGIRSIVVAAFLADGTLSSAEIYELPEEAA
jgi:hypothetical protein